MLFTANEFNELQTVRIVDLEWSLFILGFFMSGLGWENLAAETVKYKIKLNTFKILIFLSSLIGH
jgi:hypothetical protein